MVTCLKLILPISQVLIIIVIWQAFPLKVSVTQVTRLEVSVIETLYQLDAGGAAEAAGAASRHRVSCVLRGAFTALVGAACGGRSVAGLETGAGLTVAPGQRRGAVRQAGHAASVGLVAVVAHVAALHAARQRDTKDGCFINKHFTGRSLDKTPNALY